MGAFIIQRGVQTFYCREDYFEEKYRSKNIPDLFTINNKRVFFSMKEESDKIHRKGNSVPNYEGKLKIAQ